MRVVVEMYGLLRRHLPGEKRIEIEVEEGTTVAELLQQLGVPKDVPWNAALDGKLVDPAHKLVDGASLLVIPPIEGG